MTDSATSTWIVHADDRTDIPIGGKASALRAMRGFEVPQWFVVTPAARDSLHAGQEGALRAAVDDAVERLGDTATLWAVRSSAVCEDGVADSFAGQFESFLDVEPQDVFVHVCRVWESAKSARVGTYQKERGLGEADVEMAVLVQRMVAPQFAGVAFAVDPVTGDDEVVISAVRGTAERLVAGEVTGIDARVDPDARVTHGDEAEKLPENIASEVANLARDVSRQAGRPQDIEWAFDGERLHLLQARPITTAPFGELAVWDNSNIAESYNGVTTPLTFSFALKAYEEVYRTFCKLLGVSQQVRRSNAQVFANMLGHHNGRVYYNLMNWYRLIAMLPGYRMNAPFMEQMMGVQSGLPDAAFRILREEAAASRTGPIVDGLRLVRGVLALGYRHITLERAIKSFNADVDRALGAGQPRFDGTDTEALVARYRDLERTLLPRWDAPILNDFFAMIYVGVLRKMCVRLAGAEDESLHNALLLDVGSIISTEPARQIERMGVLARELGAIDRLDHASSVDEFADLEELHAALVEYVEVFGDRCLQELKLESPTLLDDPRPLLRSIAALGRRGATDHSSTTKANDHNAEQRLRESLKGKPLAALRMRFVLKRARARLRDRENLRFLRTRVFGYVRRLFLELGQHYVRLGLLDDARDVFFLEVEEALCLAGAPTDARALVNKRRLEFEQHVEAPPLASRFETRGAVAPLRPIVRPIPIDTEPADGVMRGIGCCPGLVEGRARVIRDPVGIVLEPNDILIAERTDPGWIILFPAAAAIAVEHGSILSHTSIVARELGIPCVVSVRGLLQHVADGDRLILDGTSGTLRKVEEGAG